MNPWDYGTRRTVIEAVEPQVDGGRFPVKRTTGETVVVEADVFADSHDALDAVVLYRHEDEAEWQETPLRPLPNDRWRAGFPVRRCGVYCYTMQAWVDHFASWRRDFVKRVVAGQDLSVPLEVGSRLVETAAGRASGDAAESLSEWARRLSGSAELARR